MGKQTKILLGLGAVIAAYLILKPKKAAAQTNLGTSSTTPINNWDVLICPEGYTMAIFTESNENGVPSGTCALYETTSKTTDSNGVISETFSHSLVKSEDAKPNPYFGKVIKDGVLVDVDCSNLDKTALDLFAQANSGYRGGTPPSRETENYYAKLRAEADKKINDLGLRKCYKDWFAEYQKKEMENFNIFALIQ
jgi:hypothetical protein